MHALRRISVILPVCLGLAGCLGGVSVPLIPDVNIHLNSDRERLDNWRRVLRTLDGEEVTQATYVMGTPLRLYWLTESPRGVKDAAFAGVEQACPSAGGAVAWHVVNGRAEAAGAELWHVGSVAPSEAESSVGRQTVSALMAGPILANVPVALNEEVRWLLYVPEGEERTMILEWTALDPATALRIRPCAIRWVPIPTRLYMNAVSQSPRSSVVQEGSDPRGLSGVGAPQDPVSVDLQTAERALGLIGVPEYDLQILHQAAMSVQFGGGLPVGVDRETMVWLRRERLSRVMAGTDGEKTLCQLGHERRLFDLALSLWNGDTTVPAELREKCEPGR